MRSSSLSSEGPLARKVLERFAGLNVWKRGDQRAPHKPLLALYALARLRTGQERLPYREVEPALTRLLQEFGPPRKRHNPHYPFWRLQNDGVWTIDGGDGLPTRKSNTDPPVTALRERNPTGGFAPEVADALLEDRALFASAVATLLDHFPDTYHEDLVAAISLKEPEEGIAAEPVKTYVARRRMRDPAFRLRILEIYEGCCAVCGLDLKIGGAPVGMEAAHVKWHQAGGPDQPDNGLALCSLHHRLFDRGAFTISADYEITVTEQVRGGESLNRWLLDFHRAPLRAPIREEHVPAPEFIRWHHREVFRPPPRN